MKLSSIVLASLLSVPATLAASSSSAAAQPATVAPAPMPTVAAAAAPAESKNSINVSPLGLIFGNLYLTYEHLFAGGHGLVIDAGGGSTDGDAASESHGSVGVGYRWHWRGRQNSGFLGVMLHQSVGSGEVTLGDGADAMTHDMTIRSTMLTANVGKRWMIGDKVNISLRFGLGWGHHVAEASSSGEDAEEAEAVMNGLLTLIPIGVDGELSVGYNF